MITRHRKIYIDKYTGNQSYVWFKSAGNILEATCRLKKLTDKDYCFEGSFVSDSENTTIYEDDNNQLRLIINNEFTGNDANTIILITGPDKDNIKIFIDKVDNNRLIINGHDDSGNKYILELKDNSILFEDSFNNYDIYNVRDALISNLSILKGELWYKSNYGLPLVDKIRIKSIMDAAVLNIINEQPEINSVIDFNSIIENRTYTLNFSLKSIYSDTPIAINLNR